MTLQHGGYFTPKLYYFDPKLELFENVSFTGVVSPESPSSGVHSGSSAKGSAKAVSRSRHAWHFPHI